MPELAAITKCLLCGQSFTTQYIQIIGKPDQRFEKYMQDLKKHLDARHPEQALIMVQNGGAFMEMLFLMNFQTTDEELRKKIDFVRWQVHQQTLGARIKDDKLRNTCGSLAQRLVAMVLDAKLTEGAMGAERLDDRLAREFTEELIPVFTGIRDELQEPNRYPVSTLSGAS